MKKYLILLLFSCCVFSLKAQHKVSKLKANDTTIYSAVEKEPEPKGGMSALFIEITKGVRYPEDDEGSKSRVVIDFVVEKDGSLSQFKISKRTSKDLGNQIIKNLKAFPKWSPGMLNGKPVRTRFFIPLNIDWAE